MVNPVDGASLGGYDVLHQLSQGGMGQVLLARKTGAGGFEKLVAIKTIRSDLKQRDQLRAMFLDEAKLLSRLAHPGVAQVHDFGEEGGTLFLVMEYVAGVSFGDLCEVDMPPEVAARAMAAACRGLHAAHELADKNGQPLGVVHRDVSPDNLMLTFDGQVKVLDFGIALMRGRQSPVTEFGTVKGKPPYLAPEQVRAEAIDRRTDLFAANVVLYELLTGEPLFSGDSVYAIARAIQEQEIHPPSALADDLPQALDEIVIKGLSRAADDRFQSAAELADALDEVAQQAGAMSLGKYAASALAEARSQHERWLRGILNETSSEEPVGRATGMVTAIGDAAMLASAGQVSAQASEGPETVEAADDESPVHERRSSMMWWGLILLLSVGGAGIFFFMRGQEKPVVAAIDAGPLALDAAPAAATDAAQGGDAAGKMDAAVIVDAAPVSDARRRRRTDARPRPKAKVDAAPRRIVDAAPKLSGFGTISVFASPFGLVRIDGVGSESTPVTRRRIPAGRHKIEILDPASGKVRHSRTIELKPDQSITVRAPKP